MKGIALPLPRWSFLYHQRETISRLQHPHFRYRSSSLCQYSIKNKPFNFRPSNSNFSAVCSINHAAENADFPPNEESQGKGFWSKWKIDSAKMTSELAKLGLAAVLAYGLFDGVTYTTFFTMAFLGYEKSTGKNPAANLKALLGIVILMWAGNNVTRPFRVAGAAALAPVIDKGLKKIQRYFNFPSVAYAFALVVSVVVAACLSVVGLLILSRWGR